MKIPRDEVGNFPQSPEFSEVKLPKMRIGIEKVGDEEIKMKRQKLAFTCGKYQLDSNGNVPDSSDRLIFVKRRVNSSFAHFLLRSSRPLQVQSVVELSQTAR